jgi:iron-sulfur cluster repair protein YtfE (RIC family)
MARRVAEAGPGDANALPEAAERVRRYFSEALPLHARDEEDSLLPRLRGRDPAVDVELETMAREHKEHERPLRVLVEACAALVRDPGRHGDLKSAIASSTAELERHFVAHLEREEEVIFPAVRRLLDRAADARLVEEMRGRRAGFQPAAAAAP